MAHRQILVKERAKLVDLGQSHGFKGTARKWFGKLKAGECGVDDQLRLSGPQEAPLI
ncbi:hypothetical protein KIN20_027774 [Parelaphostrongylus tenuis]|uniref:Uncharacterized protein n=1 Tax=Parelaphostrongylus tenuis TaxID=148309 RepID=A0AAD5QZS7_PARTN|nr:hypothetical protein KIN20_027774 [Parelaphostrongylus tenuis]